MLEKNLTPQHERRLGAFGRVKSLVAIGALSITAACLTTVDKENIGPEVPVAVQDVEPQVTLTAKLRKPSPVSNSITFVIDDMNDFSCEETKYYLPLSSKWLQDQGVCFENATVRSPVCCPARSEIMSGQAPHNNQVRRQIDSNQLDWRNTMQWRLRKAGIETYGVGKLLNGLDYVSVATGELDTGFSRHDFWPSYTYYDYRMIDSDGEYYVPSERLHTTTRTGMLIREFIQDNIDRKNKFSVYGAFYAPHDQVKTSGGSGGIDPVPTPEHRHDTVPEFEYNPEADTTDKNPAIQSHPRNKADLIARHKARVRSLYDVDEQMAETFTLLERNKMLGRTAVIFVSDNGYQMGNNNRKGKAVPYPASLNVPMLAYIPGQNLEGTIDERRTGLLDIAPTIYDLHGVNPGYLVDGHSLLSQHERTDQFHEFFTEDSEIAVQESGKYVANIPSWAEVVSDEGAYIEWYDVAGKVTWREFYDSSDKYYEHNLLYPEYHDIKPHNSLIRELRSKLQAYRNCKGTDKTNPSNPCP